MQQNNFFDEFTGENMEKRGGHKGGPISSGIRERVFISRDLVSQQLGILIVNSAIPRGSEFMRSRRDDLRGKEHD